MFAFCILQLCCRWMLVHPSHCCLQQLDQRVKPTASLVQCFSLPLCWRRCGGLSSSRTELQHIYTSGLWAEAQASIALKARPYPHSPWPTESSKLCPCLSCQCLTHVSKQFWGKHQTTVVVPGCAADPPCPAPALGTMAVAEAQLLLPTHLSRGKIEGTNSMVKLG